MRPKIRLLFWLIMLQLLLLISAILCVKSIVSVAAQTETAIDRYSVMVLAFSSALAVGMTGLAAGFAIKTAGTAAISLLSERPEQFFKAFLVVAFGEALAVYGLIIGILLWTKIP